MATYASTTNPFIESLNNQDRLEGSVRKNAPGMARPHHEAAQIISQRREANSLQGHEGRGKKPDVDEAEVNIEGKSFETTAGSEDEVHKRQSTVFESSNEDLEAEITKTCESLVETAARLSLDCSNIKSSDHDSNFEKRTERSQSTTEDGDDTQELDDGDDDEADDDGAVANEETLSEGGPMDQDSRKYKHIELIKKLRLQLRDLERYAYERGELQQVPPSVLAERQTVIIDTLKEKLSLNIDKETIEKLGLDELKKQVDKEVHDLIDPLITKEYLLSQLKTQLTDLERYISHLHGTLRRNSVKHSDCSCQLHGCSTSSPSISKLNESFNSSFGTDSQRGLINGSPGTDATLSKTTRLIRGLIAQLICSDMKIQECVRREQTLTSGDGNNNDTQSWTCNKSACPTPIKAPQFHDGAAWTLHIDKVILATDSLMNLYTLEPQYQRSGDKYLDERLVESVVRRQLVPAIRDLLTYGLIDPTQFPRSTSYTSFLFDPYNLLSSLTCFPSATKTSDEQISLDNKIHIWHVIEDYFKLRNEPNFQRSSIKTLSQSFNLKPSLNGPIKMTSRQALLIAVDDIIEKLSKTRPNGPESHFRFFIYVALNQCRLAIWLKLVFKNKSLVRKYYHSFSFVSQSEKMDKFLATIEVLSRIEFKLQTDPELNDQFVSAF